MRTPLVALLVALTAVPLAAGAEPTPEPLIEHVGYTMTAQEAMERISFHPFVPSSSYTAVALLPAFHGDDKEHAENRGIGYGYVSDGVNYVLREWPRAGGTLTIYSAYKRAPKACAQAFYTLGTVDAPRAVAWQTQTMIYTLQPDLSSRGPSNTHALENEWKRLARRGACR